MPRDTDILMADDQTATEPAETEETTEQAEPVEPEQAETAEEAPETEEAPEQPEEEPEQAEQPEEEETAEEEEAAEPEEEPAPEGSEMERSLAEWYREYPALKQFLKEHPELRPAFFKAREYDRLFGTVDDARTARDWALDYWQMYQYWMGGPEDKRQLLNVLWETSLGPDGQSTGHYEQLAQLVTSDVLTQIERGLQNPQVAQQWLAQTGLERPEQLGVALEVIRRILGLSQGTGQQAAGPAARPAAPGMDALAQREAALRAREQALQQRMEQEFVTSVRSEFARWLSQQVSRYTEKATAVDALLKKRPGLRPLIEEIIQRKTAETLLADTLFTSRLNALAAQRGLTPETAQAMVDALRARARQVMPQIASGVLRDLGLQLQQEAEQARRLAQTGGRRRQPLSGSPGRLGPGPARTPPKPKEGESYQAYATRLLNEEET